MTNTLDEQRLQELASRLAADMGAAMHASTVLLGDRLGLYEAMADLEPLTAEELAERTGTDARHVQEWLAAQAASGYVTYQSDNGTFALTPEQAFALTDEFGPMFAPAGFQAAAAAMRDLDLLEESFRSGSGLGWHEHDEELFHGTERFYRPGYVASLLPEWIPSIDGLHERLTEGAAVLDVGCGHGAVSILLAQAYPRSRFVGIDSHGASIAAAEAAAERAGVGDRVEFRVSSAEEFEQHGYDLALMFDALHDIGDPVAAVRAIGKSLSTDGVLMIVEPRAGDRLEDNLNPIGRIFYSASTNFCVPGAISQNGERVLGAQAGTRRIRQGVEDAGFRSFSVAAETMFNVVFEAGV